MALISSSGYFNVRTSQQQFRWPITMDMKSHMIVSHIYDSLYLKVKNNNAKKFKTTFYEKITAESIHKTRGSCTLLYSTEKYCDYNADNGATFS